MNCSRTGLDLLDRAISRDTLATLQGTRLVAKSRAERFKDRSHPAVAVCSDADLTAYLCPCKLLVTPALTGPLEPKRRPLRCPAVKLHPASPPDPHRTAPSGQTSGKCRQTRRG